MTERSSRLLANGVGFTEGPIVTEGGDVVFTSIDTGLLHGIDASGNVAVVGVLGGGPNGACEAGGSYYIAQNGGNWMVGREQGVVVTMPAAAGVQRVEPGGSVTPRADGFVAPNDICPGPDGLLYVTDPTRRRTYDDGRIWRVDPTSGATHMLYQLDWFPNGIAFGFDDDVMYVASTGAQRIMRLPIEPGGAAPGGEVSIEMPFGFPDGIGFDADGHLIVCALSKSEEPGEIQVWDTRGALLERWSPGPGKKYTNVALSGDGTLVITDSDAGSVLAVDWPVAGLSLFPRRRSTMLAPELAPGLRP